MRNEMRIEKSTLVLLVLLTYCDDNWKFRLSMRMKSEKEKTQNSTNNTWNGFPTNEKQ